MANEPDEEFDPWDADIWTLEGLGFDIGEIARGEQDAGDEQAEDFEAYRERVLAPLYRLAERLCAEDGGGAESPSEGVVGGAGAAKGSVEAG